MNLRKYAQQAVRWEQVAKSQGYRMEEYLAKIKSSSDSKLLSQLARAVPSYKGFGGAPLTGFQRKALSAAAQQRLRSMGQAGLEDPTMSSTI